MIKVGVSPCIMYADDSRTSFAPKKLDYIVQDMARYLHREGVMPILIPSLPSKELRAFVREMDGIVLQGGADVAPETYKETSIGQWNGDAVRDRLELEIIKYALEYELPLFGICRGFQLLNVFYGGTLYQDIATQFETSTVHKGTNYDQNTHHINIDEGSVLYKMNNNQKKATVNSVHHQAVKTLGSELKPMAWAEGDNIVEAFEVRSFLEGKVFGVQWHPEFDWNHPLDLFPAEKLYDHFLRFCEL